MKTWFKSGSWNAICDSCGLRFKASELRERWDGLMVDQLCWEPRHPQDFIRGVEDDPSVDWARPEGQDVFIPVCYLWGRSAYADLAEADCAQANNSLFPYLLLKALKEGH